MRGKNSAFETNQVRSRESYHRRKAIKLLESSIVEEIPEDQIIEDSEYNNIFQENLELKEEIKILQEQLKEKKIMKLLNTLMTKGNALLLHLGSLFMSYLKNM